TFLPGDILRAGSTAKQIACGSRLTLALKPDSEIYLSRGRNSVTLEPRNGSFFWAGATESMNRPVVSLSLSYLILDFFPTHRSGESTVTVMAHKIHVYVQSPMEIYSHRKLL